MMSGKQFFRNGQSFPNSWSRVLRVFKQSAAEGLFVDGCLIPKNERYKAHCRVNQGLSRDFTAGKHEISD